MVEAPAPPIAAPTVRPGLPLADVAGSLGPLTDLAGTWIGKGFSLISLPDFGSAPPSTGRIDWPHISVARLTKQ